MDCPVHLSFSFSGAQDVSRVLMAIDARASDFTPAWPLMDEAFHAIERAQFASEGEHGGEPWAALRPSTQRARARMGLGPGHPILRRRGDLERSLTSLNSDAITVHTPTAYRRGTAVPYYVFHQVGTSRMGARPPVELTAADKEELIRPLRVYLRGGEPSSGATTRYASAFATTGGAR